MNYFWRDEQLPWVESRKAINSRNCYRPHSHPYYSIGVIDAGQSFFSAACGFQQVLQPQQLICIPAELTHSCNPEPKHAWAYQMLHVQPKWLRTCLQKLGKQPSTFMQQIHIHRCPSLYRYFSQCNALLFSNASIAQKEQALIGLIAYISNAPRHHSVIAPDITTRQQTLLLSAQQFLYQQPSLTFTLQECAHAIGLSPYQLIRLFRSHTGLTPQRWQINYRINLARHALSQQESISQVAYELGFADQSHFQRVFKQYTGATPKQYQHSR